MSMSINMWAYFAGIPTSVAELLTPELRSRIESQTMPEEGTRSEIKNAIFAAYELGVQVYDAYYEAIRAQLVSCAKEYVFQITKPDPVFFAPELVEDIRSLRGRSTSVFRKIYGIGGVNTVLRDRTKGVMFNDDS
jgi:hypothetical protein